MKYILPPSIRNVPERTLLADVKRVARSLKVKSLTRDEYSRHGKFSAVTIGRRFGGWNNTLIKARLKVSHPLDIPLKDLMENLKQLWDKLGRNPAREDLVKPYSRYSASPYITRFGTWRKALEAFVKYANSPGSKGWAKSVKQVRVFQKKRSRRTVNKSLRFTVMARDNFKCALCGRSPATELGTRLHVDHIKPWSKGGETTAENLQTLCSACNLGKSNKTIKQ